MTPWVDCGAIFDVRGVAPQNQVTFSGFSGNSTAWQSYDRQVTPTPEPATYGLIFVALAIGLTRGVRGLSNRAVKAN